MDRIFFHIDVNSAFLSWTAVDRLNQGDPVDLRTIPSIIGGDMEKRHGVVLAKSIPAKTYHITTGEPVVHAFSKCPTLVMAPPDHSMYSAKSRQLMDYLKSISPDIEQVSIDECYMDFTPIASKYPSPVAAACFIKDSVYEKFKFTVNVGISDKKILAKMASDFKKPNLVHTLYTSEIHEKLWPLPVSSLFMCGKSSAEELRKLELLTIGDLARANPEILTLHLKSHGRLLWQYANGIDDSIVEVVPADLKGVGNSTTLPEDVTNPDTIYKVLLALAESVSSRLRKAGHLASMISVEIKYSTFTKVSHQTTLPVPTCNTDEIYRTALTLFDETWDATPIRLLGIRTSKLTDYKEPRQLNLFDLEKQTMEYSAAGSKRNAEASHEKKERLDRALDSIRQKYGSSSVVRGSMLHSDLPHNFKK